MGKIASFFQRHKRLILIICLAALSRLVIAFSFFGTYDSVIAQHMYHYAFKAGDINAFYSGQGGLAHFPGWLFLLWVIGFFSKLTGIAYNIVFKFPSILADLGVSILIYIAFLKRGQTPEKSSNWTALYALNPVPLLVGSINGQFDSLTIFFCLLSWYVWRFSARFKIASSLFLGIGVIVKEFPAMLLPAFLAGFRQIRERLKCAVYFLLPIIATFVIAYFTISLRFFRQFVPWILSYRSTKGFWGIELITNFLANNIHNRFFVGLDFFAEHYMRYFSLLFIIFIWFLCFKKKRDTLTSIILTLAAFYFVAPGGAGQYLIWIIPFAVINKDPMLKFYMIFSSMVVVLWLGPCMATNDPAGTYHSVKLINVTRNMFAVLTWATTGVWMYRLLKALL